MKSRSTSEAARSWARQACTKASRNSFSTRMRRPESLVDMARRISCGYTTVYPHDILRAKIGGKERTAGTYFTMPVHMFGQLAALANPAGRTSCLVAPVVLSERTDYFCGKCHVSSSQAAVFQEPLGVRERAPKQKSCWTSPFPGTVQVRDSSPRRRTQRTGDVRAELQAVGLALRRYLLGHRHGWASPVAQLACQRLLWQFLMAIRSIDDSREPALAWQQHPITHGAIDSTDQHARRLTGPIEFTLRGDQPQRAALRSPTSLNTPPNSQPGGGAQARLPLEDLRCHIRRPPEGWKAAGKL